VLNWSSFIGIPAFNDYFVAEIVAQKVKQQEKAVHLCK
jgi:hypothetical protein